MAHRASALRALGRAAHAAGRPSRTRGLATPWGSGDGGDGTPARQRQAPPPRPARTPLPPAPPPGPSSPALPAARARALQRSSTPPITVRIAGVTFEGRQAAVAALTPGQSVRCLPEPANPVDPDAVAVETLPGARLGYVPADRTGEVFGGESASSAGLPHAYARVVSVGQAAPNEEEEEEDGHGHPHPDSPWGAAVSLHPGLPPLDPDALPPSLRPASDLAAWLPPLTWEALRAATARAAGFRCEVTGGRGAGCAVFVHEAWRLEPAARIARLTGLQALAPEVHIAKHALVLTRPSDVATALAALRAVNEWSVEEAVGVVSAAAAAAAAAEAEGGWRLDLSWLGEAAGVRFDALPPDVAAVCVPW